MPGPSNAKTKKRKPQVKNQINLGNRDEPHSSPVASCSEKCFAQEQQCPSGSIRSERNSIMPQPPLLYDPGNGPRVRNVSAFLESKYFVQPPALDIPLCAEFAQEEVLEMLLTVLPEEMALILWYNKSRATSRICPACQRIYRIGDVLPDHFPDDTSKSKFKETTTSSSPQKLQREQSLSGLCSPVCFILASINYPDAIRSAWGHTEEELDDDTWGLLNGRAENNATGEVGEGLSMLMRMSRLHDLGLGQLCLGLNVEDERDLDPLVEEGLGVP